MEKKKAKFYILVFVIFAWSIVFLFEPIPTTGTERLLLFIFTERLVDVWVEARY